MSGMTLEQKTLRRVRQINRFESRLDWMKRNRQDSVKIDGVTFTRRRCEKIFESLSCGPEEMQAAIEEAERQQRETA